jgi:hypothetical protein
MKILFISIALIVSSSSVYAAKRFMPMVDDEVLKETRVDYLTTIPDIEEGEQNPKTSNSHNKEQVISPADAGTAIAPVAPRISPITPVQGVSVQVRPR